MPLLFLQDLFYKIKDPEGSPRDKQDITCQQELRVRALESDFDMSDHENHQCCEDEGHEDRIEYFQNFVSHTLYLFSERKGKIFCCIP